MAKDRKIDLVILGLLAHEDLTGYDIKKRIDGRKKGEDGLKAWLKEERVSNELKYETLLKLYFGGVEDRSVTIRNIELFEENIRHDLEVLKIYKSNTYPSFVLFHHLLFQLY